MENDTLPPEPVKRVGGCYEDFDCIQDFTLETFTKLIKECQEKTYHNFTVAGYTNIEFDRFNFGTADDYKYGEITNTHPTLSLWFTRDETEKEKTKRLQYEMEKAEQERQRRIEQETRNAAMLQAQEKHDRKEYERLRKIFG